MRRYLLAGLAVLVLSNVAQSQTTGLPPFGSLDQVGLEVRNNQDLNVLLAIPIMSSPGRNGLDLNFSLVYNSSIWTNGGGYWTLPANNPNWGWVTSYSTGQVTYHYSSTQHPCNHLLGDVEYEYITTYSNFNYTDPLNTVHPFGVFWQQIVNQCTNSTTTSGTFTGYATDDSGYYITLNSTYGGLQSLLAKGGLNLTVNGQVTDTNGNYISSAVNGNETDWTDSRGQKALKVVTNGTTSLQYEFLDPTGNYQTTTVTLETLSVKTNFGCPNVTEFTGSATVPQKITLPNQQTYTFTYESYLSGGTTYYTGRLQQVNLPTGGYYQYTYTGANDGINCADGTTLSMNRTASDGTNSKTWNYVRNTSNLNTTITTPQLADTTQANDMVVIFNSSDQEIQRLIYSNSPHSGNPIRYINTSWASNGSPSNQVTILEDGSTQSKVATTYDSNGLLDSVSEYGFGAGAPGSIFRTTNYTYNTSTNYTNLNILDLVISKQIENGSGTVQYRQDTTYDAAAGDNQNCPSGVPQHNDAGYGCSFYYRGNPTSVTTYLAPATQGSPVTKNFTYDWFGNLLTAQVNCCQLKTWAYSTATEYSEPDSVTSGSSSPTLETFATYNSYTGQVAAFTDENNLVTNFSYDVYRRPKEISQTYSSNNVGGTVTYSYNDTVSPFSATTTAQIDSSKSVQQITAVDGLGRPNLTTVEDISDNIYSKVSTVYDLTGRPYQTSNPYTGSSGSYWTTTSFDVLGRPTSIALTDNSAATYSYATNTFTVTDPAGVKRESVMDSGGRLSSVYEPDPTNGNTLTLQSSYTYNVLDELTQVTQGSQTRTYVYDALGRLNSTTTPEGGTVCYGQIVSGVCGNGYDSFDNLLYRTDARGVVTNYIYDTLNRLLGVAYTVTNGVGPMPNICETTGSNSNNANVCFTYGTSASSFNNGRLASMADPTGSGAYTYNDLGQFTQLQKIIGTTTYNTYYQYNLASEVTQITYPSGRLVQQAVDTIGRLCAIATSVNTTCGASSGPFATGFGYSAANQLTSFAYGNNIYASFGFSSDRLQLNCLDYSTTNRSGTGCAHDGTTKFGLTYSYGAAGSNNGEINSITDYMDNGRTITYTYDALYRMTKAVTNGSTNYPAWGLSETYDRYGNRSAQAIASGCTGITCPTNSVSPSATTNQLTGSPYTYDASGDMTNDGVNTLTYDGEGRAVAASGSLGSGTYSVDGNGLRVKKVAGSTTTVYIFSGSKVIAEYQNGAAPSAPTTEYVYAGGTLIAKINSSGTNYYHQDHLSNRYVTNSSGGMVAQMGHFPFGESWYNATSDKLYFTTYEYDSESGNHYAMARYHVSRLGRLSSPDPLSGSVANPQSLNRYSYSLNDPTNLTDPSGTTTGCNTADATPADGPVQSSRGHSADGDSGAGTNVGDPAPQQNPCETRVNPWASGGISLDGADITDVPELAGGGDASSQCPNNDCSLLNRPYTAANGYQYWIWLGVDGVDYTSVLNGDEVFANSENGLPEYGDSDSPTAPDSAQDAAQGPAQVNLDRLKDCISSLFHVAMMSFVPSHAGVPGQAGSFTGSMAGVFTGTGSPLAPGPSVFSVTNYVNKTGGALTATYILSGGTVPPGIGVIGLTGTSNPFVNYTAEGLSGSQTTEVQIWELGNSLGYITGNFVSNPNTSIGSANTESGSRLQNCYRGRS